MMLINTEKTPDLEAQALSIHTGNKTGSHKNGSGHFCRPEN